MQVFRRIVTGHDDAGNSYVVSDCAPPRIRQVGGAIGPVFHEVWNTQATPAPITARAGEPVENELRLAPPKRGTRIRVLDIPPESDALKNLDPIAAREHFASIGAAEAVGHKPGHQRHPFMHRTETIDYGIVLEGELVLILDQDETTVRAGDIVIQCGTNHAWSNRSGKNCRIAFILIDGCFADGLEQTAHS